MRKLTARSGFTIVELLIVVVVIGILAAITIVAYNGIQGRARDSARLNDINGLKKALSLYKIDNGVFPATAPNPGSSTWEISSDPGFMASLQPTYLSRTLADPKPGVNGYWYHTFAAGTYGCPASLGAYYVIWARGMEAQAATYLDTAGCTGQTLIAGASLTNPSYAYFYGFN